MFSLYNHLATKLVFVLFMSCLKCPRAFIWIKFLPPLVGSYVIVFATFER